MGKKILVVEDEIEIRELLCTLLAENGYTVIAATDGTEGLSLATTEIPDLIISDVMMQVMSGAVMTARLKEDPQTARIPIIFLTGVVDKDEADLTGNQLAGERLLAKPFQASELLSMVESALNS